MAVNEPPQHPFARPQPPPPDPVTPLAGLALQPMQRRFGAVPVLGLYALLNGLVSIGVMSAAAMATGAALVFPSLGPTAYLLFSDPLGAAAAPRNALLGHAIGVAAGYGALVAFGVAATDAMAVTSGRVGAAATSLAVTSGLMVWLRVPHPPAAATTLIVSLGILDRPADLAVLLAAVALLVVQGVVINRLAGVPYPLWSPAAPAVPLPGGYGPHVAPPTDGGDPSRS